MSLKEETEKDILTLLRLVYDRADWKQIGRRNNKYDVFSHKIKAASHQQNIKRFLNKLTYSLGVQSIPISPDLIKRLEAEQSKVLDSLRKEQVYYVACIAEGKVGGEV